VVYFPVQINMVIRFCPGRLRTKPDALTHRPDLYPKGEKKPYGTANPQNCCPVFSSCQGFTKSHSRLGLNRLRPQGLKEYSDSYLVSDYLGPVLGSKCLVTQTTGNYLGLGPLEETSEKMFQAATWTFNLLYCFSYVYINWSHFSG
jgi:hypothetical protein